MQAEYAALMQEDALDVDQMETKAKEFTLAGAAAPYRRPPFPPRLLPPPKRARAY